MVILNKKFLSDRFEAAYEVDEPHSGMRLDQFILSFLGPGFSRENVKEKIKLGDIKIRNRVGKHKPNTKVYEKEIIDFVIYKTTQEDEYWNGEKIELESSVQIIHEDDDIFVISKPSYMATHPTGKHLFNCATVVLEQRTQKTVHSVHRLDRETSGVLVLAKNPKAANQITPLFEKELVKKCYFFIACTKGDFKEEFTATERLGSETKTGLKRVYINSYPENSREGKRALTHFQIIHKEKNYALGLAYPQTGRQHQIRVHAMVHGLPLLGDKMYLGSFEMFQRFKDRWASKEDHELMQLPRHALHAIAINFPYQEKRSTFKSSLPLDLKDWIQSHLEVCVSKLEEQIKENIENYFNKLDK